MICPALVATATSAIVASSVSPDLWDTTAVYPALFAISIASKVSVNEPIWFNFIRIEFPAPNSIPFFNLSVLVTNKSSPTICTLSPIALVSFTQPSQSSSPNPSSIETIGYLFINSSYHLIIASVSLTPPSLLKWYSYFPFTSLQNSLEAASKAKVISFPNSYPAALTASHIKFKAPSVPWIFEGAYPPSFPTFVESPLAFKIFPKWWKISAPILIASWKDFAPTGCIINSCKSTAESACAPPFKIFIIGKGNSLAFTPPKYLYRGCPKASAAALATARETPKIAFAPSLPLLGVPSNSIINLSIATWFKASIPKRASLISVFTLFTAFKTPFPRYLDLSSSLSSTASWLPVEAPDGTAALPLAPHSNTTSTSTVGFPLESKISLPITSTIPVIAFLL